MGPSDSILAGSFPLGAEAPRCVEAGFSAVGVFAVADPANEVAKADDGKNEEDDDGFQHEGLRFQKL